MHNAGREKIFKKCDAMGVSWARSITLAPGDPSEWESKQVTLEWIDRHERNERLALEEKQLALASQSVEAARASANAAHASAEYAKDSAKATRLAALFAMGAVIVAIAQAIISASQK